MKSSVATLILHGMIAVLVTATGSVHADHRLELVAQFGSKAAIKVDGVQRIINLNDKSPEGVQLLQMENDYVVVLVDGKKRKIGFNTELSTQYESKTFSKVDIWPDQRGSYYTAGSINGQVVRFLVDTGATSIAMNNAVAKRLGIDYRYQGRPMHVTTASGVTTGYAIMLDTVKVGEIQLKNVEASVLEGGFPTEVLLGMSFLKHVDLERKDSLMTLRYSQ